MALSVLRFFGYSDFDFKWTARESFMSEIKCFYFSSNAVIETLVTDHGFLATTAVTCTEGERRMVFPVSLYDEYSVLNDSECVINDEILNFFKRILKSHCRYPSKADIKFLSNLLPLSSENQEIEQRGLGASADLDILKFAIGTAYEGYTSDADISCLTGSNFIGCFDPIKGKQFNSPNKLLKFQVISGKQEETVYFMTKKHVLTFYGISFLDTENSYTDIDQITKILKYSNFNMELFESVIIDSNMHGKFVTSADIKTLEIEALAKNDVKFFVSVELEMNKYGYLETKHFMKVSCGDGILRNYASPYKAGFRIWDTPETAIWLLRNKGFSLHHVCVKIG
jgi:hypothetical protein